MVGFCNLFYRKNNFLTATSRTNWALNCPVWWFISKYTIGGRVRESKIVRYL